MMLRRLSLRDFVIVTSLELEFDAGFSVLTGETGAGKSILVDALQLVLGSRGDAGMVREGAARTELSAEFDTPPTLVAWLTEAGFDATADPGRLLLRRTIDVQGKSRAWVNGSPATIAQLREAADPLVEIHGQHAWQSLTRPAAVRALLDAWARVDAAPLAALWADWRAAQQALTDARDRQGECERERERLAWQIGEVDKLAPGADEWAELDAEHSRLANAQSLLEAARGALEAVSEAEQNAESLTARALDALQVVAAFDARLASAIEALQGAQAQLQDAAHTLGSYLHHSEPDPGRLEELDQRISAWLSLARRWHRLPAELPALVQQWRGELQALEASSDVAALEAALADAANAYDADARRISVARRAAAAPFGVAVTRAMQRLGMADGRFEVALAVQAAPQSFGLEAAEFLVAGHAGSTPRPLAKVASGGELSRIALAIAVTTSQLEQPEAAVGTLIFDEIDAGVGGAVAESVGQLMKQLGDERQVLAVTHLPQVAACADHHYVVTKVSEGGATRSEVGMVQGEARIAEIARMLAGERLSSTSLAHAQEMLSVGTTAAPRRRGRS